MITIIQSLYIATVTLIIAIYAHISMLNTKIWYNSTGLATIAGTSSLMTSSILGIIIYKSVDSALVAASLGILPILWIARIATHRHSLNIEIIALIPLLTMSAGALMILYDLAMLFTVLEIVTISSLLLIAGNQVSSYAIEASMKYYIVSSIAAILSYISIIVLLRDTGMANINAHPLLCQAIAGVTQSTHHCSSLMLTMIVAKVAVAPMHIWMLEIIEGLNPVAIIYTMVIAKLGYLALLFQVFQWSTMTSMPGNVAVTIGLATMCTAILAGTSETSLRRLLVSSSMMHIGILIGSSSVINTGIGQSIIEAYIITYVISSLGLISLTIATDKSCARYIKDYGKINTQMVISSMICLNIIILIALPPTNLFIAKLLLIGALMLITGNLIIISVILVVKAIAVIYYTNLAFHILSYTTMIAKESRRQHEITWVNPITKALSNGILVANSIITISLEPDI